MFTKSCFKCSLSSIVFCTKSKENWNKCMPRFWWRITILIHSFFFFFIWTSEHLNMIYHNYLVKKLNLTTKKRITKHFISYDTRTSGTKGENRDLPVNLNAEIDTGPFEVDSAFFVFKLCWIMLSSVNSAG